MIQTVSLSGIVWRHAVSGRGAKLFVGTILLVAVAAQLAAVFSLRQPAAVALDVGVSTYKILIVLLGVVWVQEFIVRDLDRKSILLPLSAPISRAQYLFSRYLGILGLTAVATVLMAAAAWIVSMLWIGVPQAIPVGGFAALAATFFLLFLEQAVILAFAVSVASVATVQALPMFAPIAFAVVGRSIGPVIVFLTQVDTQNKWVSAELHQTVGGLEWLLPDLSRFDLRGTLLYAEAIPAETVGLLLALALGYSVLLLAIASWAFSRRDLV